MYITNNDQDNYCLFYYTQDTVICDSFCLNPPYYEQIMSYCFRSIDLMIINNLKSSFDSGINFITLRENNITSQMLLSWSASFDTAEKYQIFLNNYSNSSSENEMIFYNCTSSWFGPFCRLKFDEELSGSFSDIIISIFSEKESSDDSIKVTCYIHLTCQSILFCLDWREICDGKQDCLDGSDEKQCWQLEIKLCNDDEYRCVNGQCVPIEYVYNDVVSVDCLDRTDNVQLSNKGCFQNPDFQCEEHSCRPGEEEFPCGDGQCINELSKCFNGRHQFLSNNFCSHLTICSMNIHNYIDHNSCLLFCSTPNCVQNNCSIIYEFRMLPLLFGHVQIIVSSKEILTYDISTPNYVCYDEKRCPHFPFPTAIFRNFTCHHFHDLNLRRIYSNSQIRLLIHHIKNIFRGCLVIVNESYYCNKSTMYQCENSTKCISKFRLMNGIRDCPFNDDETYNQSCSLNDIHQRFKCRDEYIDKCYALIAKKNGKKECKYGEDEYGHRDLFLKTHISFSIICDTFTNLLPLMIDEQIETDETGCQHWQCNNTYTRCDRFWHCKNGADEIDCSPSTCPNYHHECIYPNDIFTLSCLPIARAGNDIDDCLGGSDERTKYYGLQTANDVTELIYRFHCQNDTKLILFNHLCDNKTQCRFNDDERFCSILGKPYNKLCYNKENLQTDVEKFLCRLNRESVQKKIDYFKLYNVMSYPSRIVTNETYSTDLSIRSKDLLIETNLKKNIPSDLVWWCIRGIRIHVRMTENTTILSCLCPPSYYGKRCEYQNQRVSLTIRIRIASEWRNTFIFLFTLIDNERNIESHEYLEYLLARDCNARFHINLIYSTRPKNSSKFYFVQIDVFNHLTLNYRASWIFPLHFSFLPVHRLSVLLRVPFSHKRFTQQKCSPSCIHGQCIHYINNESSTFCRCEPGWFGVQCNTKYICNCAPGAMCISQSICLCPLDRFGAHCHLSHLSCDSLLCLNGGRCIPIDIRYTHSDKNRSICICPEGYIGNHCEKKQKQNQIDISFHRKLTVPFSLLIHLIEVREHNINGQDHLYTEPSRTTIAKKLHFNQYSLTIYTTTSFNIALAQISNQFYLIILREQVINFASISTQIHPSYRCRSLSELFNKTFPFEHLLKRIKSYHIPCQQHLELICFYDDVHICLCTLDRSTNCFEFNHNMTYDCNKYHYCENDGTCFQDDFECATLSFCTCLLCYFGSRCQFSTKESTLSLDIILGYHFLSNKSITKQSIIVKIAILLTILISFLGIINSFLSYQTFRQQKTQTVGCGIYLLTSSIISLCIVIMLILKFMFLIVSQINLFNNSLFLQIQCMLMDFVLRSLLSIVDWLNVCIAIERIVNVTQGISFNKTKSRQVAKLVIFFVIFITNCSFIYDPIYRRLEFDNEEQKLWCLSQYSTIVQVYDRFLNIFHFSIPFSINCISAIIIIIVTTNTRSSSQKDKLFKEHFYEQLQKHKHLLTSSLILTLLALPRLILTFLSGCMGSSRESWFYMFGYFIAYLPSVMTFIIFILPSQVYMEEFNAYIRQIWYCLTNLNK